MSKEDDLGFAQTKLDLGRTPASIGAVAVDTGARPKLALPSPQPAASPEEEEAAPRRRSLRRVACMMFVGVALAGCLTIVAVAAVRAGNAQSDVAESNALVAPAPATPAPVEPPAGLAAAAAAAPPPATAPEPASAPARADHPATPPARDAHAATTKTATISLAPNAKGKALVVDGKRSKTPSVVVTCGTHTVAVGAEKPHKVDAPCGKTVVVGTAVAAKRTH